MANSSSIGNRQRSYSAPNLGSSQRTNKINTNSNQGSNSATGITQGILGLKPVGSSGDEIKTQYSDFVEDITNVLAAKAFDDKGMSTCCSQEQHKSLNQNSVNLIRGQVNSITDRNDAGALLHEIVSADLGLDPKATARAELLLLGNHGLGGNGYGGRVNSEHIIPEANRRTKPPTSQLAHQAQKSQKTNQTAPVTGNPRLNQCYADAALRIIASEPNLITYLCKNHPNDAIKVAATKFFDSTASDKWAVGNADKLALLTALGHDGVQMDTGEFLGRVFESYPNVIDETLTGSSVSRQSNYQFLRDLMDNSIDYNTFMQRYLTQPPDFKPDDGVSLIEAEIVSLESKLNKSTADTSQLQTLNNTRQTFLDYMGRKEEIGLFMNKFENSETSQEAEAHFNRLLDNNQFDTFRTFVQQQQFYMLSRQPQEQISTQANTQALAAEVTAKLNEQSNKIIILGNHTATERAQVESSAGHYVAIGRDAANPQNPVVYDTATGDGNGVDFNASNYGNYRIHSVFQVLPAIQQATN